MVRMEGIEPPVSEDARVTAEYQVRKVASPKMAYAVSAALTKAGFGVPLARWRDVYGATKENRTPVIP